MGLIFRAHFGLQELSDWTRPAIELC